MSWSSIACRLCFKFSRPALELTPTPIANSFPDKPDAGAQRFPLGLMQCSDCGHVQVTGYPHDDELYGSGYKYSTPDAMLPHLRETAKLLRRELPDAKSVVEIGCNNGMNMFALAEQGFNVIGVDPSSSPVEGRVLNKRFTPTVVQDLGKVDLIVANNVLAHVEQMWDTFHAIDKCLDDDGTLVFEVQYFRDLVARGAFDMVYHEHHDYHLIEPLVPFLRQFGLIISRIDRLPTHGGSIRFWCTRPGVSRAAWEDREIDWRRFARRIEEHKTHLRRELFEAEGRVVAFGATAKACTLIHHCDIADGIEYFVDETPAKIGKYIAGTNIPIRHPNWMKKRPPKHILLTAWNYADLIRARYPGAHLINPFPELVRRAA